MNFYGFTSTGIDLPRFVEIWSSVYPEETDALYNRNIGTLTPQGIKELFIWKNGTRLSEKKLKSVQDNYVERLARLKALPNDFPPEKFLQEEFAGGMIWKIFLLHIWQPQKYPIFDQHVYRAMIQLKTGQIAELKEDDKEKFSKYLKEYLPFFKSLGDYPKRKLDKALWMYGKFLKTNWAKMIAFEK